MKNKVALLGIAFLLTAVGTLYVKNDIGNNNSKVVNNNTVESSQSYAISSFITDEMKINTTDSTVGALISYSTDPESIGKIADNIVVVKLISLDGATMEYDGLVGMSYGKMLINNVIRGDLIAGKVIEYIKPGGTVSMAEWESYQPATANEKRALLRQESGNNVDLNNTYINTLVEDDVQIELGKTYLAYLKYNDSLKKYEIIGLGSGFREINLPQEKKSVSLTAINEKELKIKNNETNEYDSLNDYIEEYID